MPLASTADMNIVFGDAMRGRQFPQVDPQAASIGCPQLGQACSSIRAGAMEARTSSGAGVPVALLHDRASLAFDGATGFERRGLKTQRMIGFRRAMVKHLRQTPRTPAVSSGGRC
jgi:hypothetical protein